jgi:hypothetical protein
MKIQFGSFMVEISAEDTLIFAMSIFISCMGIVLVVAILGMK